MSFFHNIRNTLSRGKSSSRDTTPARSSRPSSIISGSTLGRRDSLDSRADSLSLNRGDTFILGDELANSATNSNSSTLEKKSKKSKVFGKFSTFTKRKKTPSQTTPSPEMQASYEHHPSDNATNTYYNWQKDSSLGLDYDAQSDPFHFLYDKQATLKRQQQQSSAPGTPVSSISTSDNKFDSSTYRKNSRASAVAAQQVPPTPPPSVLKEQLQQLKTNANSAELLEDAHDEEERDKYKTVTLNSFRKSFRDRFLQQQREEAAAAQYQPAWFVEVEPQAPAERGRQRERATSKENRPDFLEFANENYRPDSRSPVRDRLSRSKTRSPVKRNETFRVSEQHPEDTEAQPAIRIAFRNAVHTPPQSAGGVRIVPVGVAKPMPTSEYYQQRQTTKSQVQPRSPQRTAHGRPQTAAVGTPTAPLRSATNRSGRYQTLVQLNNSHDYNKPSHATRVQLNGHHSSSSVPSKQIPPYHSQLARYSYAVPQQQPQPQTAHRTSLHDSKMPTNATYFGGTIASGAKRQNVPFGAGYYVQQQQSVPQVKTTTTTTTTPQHQQGNKSIYYGRHQQQQHHHHHQQLHQPPQHHHTPSSHSHNSPHPPQKSRFLVSMQRRSRSPIKLPWR